MACLLGCRPGCRQARNPVGCPLTHLLHFSHATLLLPLPCSWVRLVHLHFVEVSPGLRALVQQQRCPFFATGSLALPPPICSDPLTHPPGFLQHSCDLVVGVSHNIRSVFIGDLGHVAIDYVNQSVSLFPHSVSVAQALAILRIALLILLVEEFPRLGVFKPPSSQGSIALEIHLCPGPPGRRVSVVPIV